MFESELSFLFLVLFQELLLDPSQSLLQPFPLSGTSSSHSCDTETKQKHHHIINFTYTTVEHPSMGCIMLEGALNLEIARLLL